MFIDVYVLLSTYNLYDVRAHAPHFSFISYKYVVCIHKFSTYVGVYAAAAAEYILSSSHKN